MKIRHILNIANLLYTEKILCNIITIYVINISDVFMNIFIINKILKDK